MKTLASVSSLLSVLGIASVLLSAAPTSAQTSAQTSKPAPAATEADSDGDELPDATDPHPYIAEPPLTWRVGPMKIGWKADDKMINTMTTLSQDEKSMLIKKEYNFHREVGGSVDLSTEVNAALSLNPLKLLKSGVEVSFRSRISASGGFAWNNSEQEQASTLQRIVTQEQVSKLLSDMHIEFTVLFSNYGPEDYSCRALHIPLKIGDDVATSAQPLGANSQPIDDFRIPANRGKPLPILFRAYLDTQETRKLLQQVQSGTLAVSLAESPGSINAVKSDKDAIAAQTAIGRKTCEITIEADGRGYSYCIARHDEKSGKALTLGDAFVALNDLSPPGEATLFHVVGKTLCSAFGKNNALSPRWWVCSADAGPEQVVNLDLPLPDTLRLRHRYCGSFVTAENVGMWQIDATLGKPRAHILLAFAYVGGAWRASQRLGWNEETLERSRCAQGCARSYHAWCRPHVRPCWICQG